MMGFDRKKRLTERVRGSAMSDKKYESIHWYATMLVFLVIILNSFVIKIEVLTVIAAVVYIVFMLIVRSKWKKAKTD